jgi:hypothetical protein
MGSSMGVATKLGKKLSFGAGKMTNIEDPDITLIRTSRKNNAAD